MMVSVISHVCGNVRPSLHIQFTAGERYYKEKTLETHGILPRLTLGCGKGKNQKV